MINVKHKETGLAGRVIRIEMTDSAMLIHIDSPYMQIKGVYAVQHYLAHFEAAGIDNGKESKPRQATPDWRALYV